MLTEKAIAICLLEVLNEYSDEKHIKMPFINHALKKLI